MVTPVGRPAPPINSAFARLNAGIGTPPAPAQTVAGVRPVDTGLKARAAPLPTTTQPVPRPTPPAPAPQPAATPELNRRAAAALAVLEQRRQKAHDAMIAAKKAFYAISNPTDDDWDTCKATMGEALQNHESSSAQANDLLTHINQLRDAQVALEEHLVLFEAGQRVEALREAARQVKSAARTPFSSGDHHSMREWVQQLERAKP